MISRQHRVTSALGELKAIMYLPTKLWDRELQNFPSGFLTSVARMVFVSPSCENLDPTDEELVDEIEEGGGFRIHGWLGVMEGYGVVAPK